MRRQGFDARRVEAVEREHLDAGFRAAVAQFGQAGRQLAGARAEQPAQAARARRQRACEQRFERGRIGAVQVVEHDRREPGIGPAVERDGQRLLQSQRVEPTGGRGTWKSICEALRKLLSF